MLSDADASPIPAQTPAGVLSVGGPLGWPICCDHLSTVVLVDPSQEEPAAREEHTGSRSALADPPGAGLADELVAVRTAGDRRGGVNIFCCPVCRRLSAV